MLLQKSGFPEENEIVLCKVNKIQYHSVFVNLEEYGRTGMIHISEISPGRIRNLRDYVREGKVVVCKVLRVNRERGYIDLSLRRVNEGQRREKVNFVKQEQIAEKIIEYVANQHNKKPKEIFDTIMRAIGKDYEGLYPFFEEVVDPEVDLSFTSYIKKELDEQVIADLEELINQRIKPPQVAIEGQFHIESYESNGIELIQKAFEPVEQASAAVAKYLGGGDYYLSVTASNYKDAEEQIKQLTEQIKQAFANTESTITFTRTDK